MKLALLLFLAPLVSCQPQWMVKPAPRHAAFVESEYAPFAASGTGAVDGQAFVKTRAGDVKYGAGNLVYMNPVTTYSTEWFDRTVMRGEALEPADERAKPFMRQVQADGEGRFRFEGLPPGEYFVACPISWEYAYGPTGAYACARVRVEEGKTVRAIVTR